MSIVERLRRSLEKRGGLRYAQRALCLVSHPLSYYARQIEENQPFSFVRYGDGEWASILGRSGANCDGHAYFPELRKRLRSALADKYPYDYALQFYSLKLDGRTIADYLTERNIAGPFHNADVFAFANVLGQLRPFIEALRTKPVAMIGPPFLRGIDRAFAVERFFEVPARNCFLQAEKVCAEILKWGGDRRGVVYSFSASMAANVMIHDLYPALGGENWLLDLGSIWDIYVGIKSRGWFQSLNLGPALDRNLGVTASRDPARKLCDAMTLFFNRLHVKT